MNRLVIRVLLFLCWALSAGSLAAQSLDMDLLKALKPRNVGPAGMSGRITAIDAVVANPDIVYAGSASGGLWKSVNGGIDWQPVFDTQRVASIGALAIFQKNPAIIWAGTGEGNPRNSQTSGYGIYRSLDAGATWTCMGLEETRNIHRVIIHPDNPDILYVGAQGTAWGDSEHRGVYKSTDGGKSWQKVLYVGPGTGVAELVMDPANPNKLICAMWEFRRWPWFFKSGGPGSGLYVSHDGGQTWQKRGPKEGLPEGELGRMGIAIARSNPEIVYAYVEAKENALYRSEDGGASFQKVNSKPEIGSRPFYYAEIYVDTKNENRLYSIHSTVTYSEDGGRSFKTLLGYVGAGGVHPDHHAWWIHPENPNLIYEGNDGGMAVSRDRGRSWQFIDNLPVGQFYHINYDMEIPYNLYGGMQDNGSWRGPAYVWRAGGIRNSYWEELYFGDGFDVVPDPENARQGYAMSQGGNVARYDISSGQTRSIRPLHPEGLKLRFNWNAAIAQDPFDPATIYYGSQFLHRSSNRGDSWEIISPDLTSNDPDKQKQRETGGLTPDVTNAENHCTLITIAPSPKAKGLIWTGSDDGRLHLTRDGGKTWAELSARLPGAPKNAWIPSIHPSEHDAAEAYVVLNNYRQNDWEPYLYRTRDYGQTWERIADGQDLWGYALCIVQDPVARNLLFAGTEYGLYVSIDGGAGWNRWKHGYPTVSTMDLRIHPREGDLLIGTFGRALWVLDDIRPLRELALEGAGILEKELHVFDAPDAYQAEFAQAMGVRFKADAVFAGENRRGGAMITFSTGYPRPAAPAAPAPAPAPKGKRGKQAPPPVPAPAPAPDSAPKPKKTPADTARIEIFSLSGELLRTLKAVPDTGLNRVYWGLDRKGVRFPSLQDRSWGGGGGEPGGPPVLPGMYKVRVRYRSSSDSTTLRVNYDPRVNATPEQLAAYDAQVSEMYRYVELASAGLDRLKEANKTLAQVESLLPKDNADTTLKALRKQAGALKDSIRQLMLRFDTDPEAKGIVDDSGVLNNYLFETFSYLQPFGNLYPSGNASLALARMKQEVEQMNARINRFFEAQWKPWQAQAEQQRLSPFKSYEPLELKK